MFTWKQDVRDYKIVVSRSASLYISVAEKLVFTSKNPVMYKQPKRDIKAMKKFFFPWYGADTF